MKKTIGMLAVVLFASSMANAELLKNFKYDGSVEVDAYKADNADFNKKLSDTKNGTLTRVMLNTGFDLTEDVSAVASVVKNDRNYGTASQNATGATGILDLVKFEQAYLMLKGVIGIDHKLGRQYYGEAGDMVIYYGPLMMPYTTALSVTGLDGWTGWWNNAKWTANALVAKQTRVAGTADTNIYGVVAGYTLNKNTTLGAYIYQRSKQTVARANDNLDVVGVKAYGKCPITGIGFKAEVAQNMGDNTTVATGEAAASNKASYKGTAVKVDLNYDQKFMGNWNFMGEFAMGTGDKKATDNSVKGFMAINSDFRPGLVWGGYSAATHTGLDNLTTWNLGAAYNNDKLAKLSLMAKYYNFALTQKIAGITTAGNEIDFAATWKHSDSISVMGSFGSFTPSKKYAAALLSARHDAETRLGADFIVKF